MVVFPSTTDNLLQHPFTSPTNRGLPLLKEFFSLISREKFDLRIETPLKEFMNKPVAAYPHLNKDSSDGQVQQ